MGSVSKGRTTEAPGGTGPEVCLNQLRPGATHSAQTCPLRDRNTRLTAKGLAVTTHTPGDLPSVSHIFNFLNPRDPPLGGDHSPRIIGEETEAPRGLVNSRGAVPRQASGRVGVGGQATWLQSALSHPGTVPPGTEPAEGTWERDWHFGDSVHSHLGCPHYSQDPGHH